MAQRLVRRLCEECREPYLPKRKDIPDDFPLAEIAGEGARRSTGRAAAALVATRVIAAASGSTNCCVADDEIRALANERKPSNVVKKAAVRSGYEDAAARRLGQGPRGHHVSGGSVARHERRLRQDVVCRISPTLLAVRKGRTLPV